MATPAQVYSALTIENTYHILYPTAPKNYSSFADITNWAGLGYTTGAGDVVKGIFQCIDPVGQVIYENAGYASDSFSSQDWDLTDLTAPQFNLLTYSGTDIPIYGNYRFLWKVQITPNGLSAFQVDKEFLVELNNSLAPTMSLEDTYNCNAATFTSVDTTTYGAPAGFTITSLVRTHVTRPPLVSKRSDGVTAQSTVTSSSQTNLLAATNNPLWSGSYSSSIAAVITYKSGNNYTIVNCAAVEVDTDVVCDASLCILFCYLKKLYTQYFTYVAAGNTTLATIALAKWQKGSDIFLLIQKAQTCATNDVALLTAKFYEVTGFTEGCECDCTDGTPAPVIPTTSINGTDGTDGLTAEFRFSGTLFQWKYTTSVGWTTLFDFSTIATAFLQGSGVPSSGLGNNGDTYLDVATGNIYLKTAGAWALTGNIKGDSGVIVLHNDVTDSTTVTNALEQLKTYAMAAGQMSANGDMIKIRARFTATASSVQKECYIYLGITPLTPFASMFGTNVSYAEIEVTITRTGAATGKVDGVCILGVPGTMLLNTIYSGTPFVFPLSAITPTWANAMNVQIWADDNGSSAITCELFQITYYSI